jgi:hypothetical protein
MKNLKEQTIKYITLITFLLMLFVNALANLLPINGITTAGVSDSYPNLFAPTGVTFAIWALIYLLLAAYMLYLFGMFHDAQRDSNQRKFQHISVYFSLSSVANTLWLFSWHYDIISLSMLLMIVILLCLIKINQLTGKMKLSAKEKFFVRLPFSVYFGWITIATIANATTLLVSWGWDGFGLTQSVWAAIIIIVGTIIGSAVIYKHKDTAYGLVLIWAYIGILIKHLSQNGFAGQYPAVIVTASFCIVVILIDIAYVYLSAHKKMKLDIRP